MLNLFQYLFVALNARMYFKSATNVFRIIRNLEIIQRTILSLNKVSSDLILNFIFLRVF